MNDMNDVVASDAVRGVGRRVRALRTAKGLTVQQLADAAGVSRRMLGAIELGSANPSLVTLDKIADAIGTDFASLFRPTQHDPVEVVRAGGGTVVWSTPAGSSATLVIGSSRRGGTEVWQWTLRPGDRYDAQPDPPGSEEFFLVLEGHLTLLVQDGAPTVLDATDTARLASDRTYSYLNQHDDLVRFTRVVQRH